MPIYFNKNGTHIKFKILFSQVAENATVSQHPAVNSVLPEYKVLDDVLCTSPEYEPIAFEDVMPDKHFKHATEKQRFFHKLGISVPIEVMRYTLYYIIKSPNFLF